MNKQNYPKIVWENIFKNGLILVIILATWPSISNKVSSLANLGFDNLLTVLSILLVTVCFANFAFSYENSFMESFGVRLISHLATFLFLLLTAWLIIVLYEVVRISFPTLAHPALIFSILLYLAIVLYDFWDLFRIKNKG